MHGLIVSSFWWLIHLHFDLKPNFKILRPKGVLIELGLGNDLEIAH
jgi:hypothetical protein